MTQALIRFLLQASSGSKTAVWMVTNSEFTVRLGFVRWKSTWRRYVFFPESGTLFDSTCLVALAEFCRNETARHWAALRRARSIARGQSSIDGASA